MEPRRYFSIFSSNEFFAVQVWMCSSTVRRASSLMNSRVASNSSIINCHMHTHTHEHMPPHTQSFLNAPSVQPHIHPPTCLHPMDRQ
jgi:hypothetical protein